MDRPISALSAAERRAMLKDLLKKKGAEPVAPPTDLQPDPAARYEPFPTTPIQEAYLLGRKPGFAVSGVSCHIVVEVAATALDPRRLEAAWGDLVARHDMLRAVVQSGAARVLAEVPPVRLPVLDLREAPEPARRQRLEEERARLARSCRDPAVWPPFEIQILRLQDEDWRVQIDLDLMTLDASGVLRLIDEWGRLYNQESLPPLTLSFRDYRIAAAKLEDGPAAQRARRYWEDRLESLAGPPDLPAATSADTAPTRRVLQLGADRWERLREWARVRGLTPNAVLATAFSATLAAFSAGDDHTLTLTLFDRQPLHPEVGQIVGEFTSTLLLQVRGRSGSFTERARALHDQLQVDLDHAAWPGVAVVREYNRRRGGLSAFPVVFTSTIGARAGSSAWLGRQVWGVSQTPQVYLDHQIFEEEGGLRVHWDTVDDALQPGVMAAMFAAWSRLVARLTDEEESWDQPIGALLPEAQAATRQAVNTWDDAPARDTLHGPFVRQAARTPDAVAVEGPGKTLRYGALEAASRALAWRVLRSLGEDRSELVAVLLPKGPDQAVATLGILRAGRAYLPVDPDLPAARIRTLLEDGAVQVVVSDAATLARLGEALPEGLTTIDLTQTNHHNINENAGTLPDVDPSALAYVIYTSGSTGKPKGVMISHEAAWNTIADINARFGVTEGDRVLALSALSFDLSVYDLFGLLAVGGAVVFPPPDGVKDPSTWPLDGITVWNTVPQLMEMLLDAGRTLPSSLRLAMWSGDWIPLTLPARVRAQVPAARLISLGGATEASIWSIGHEIGDINPEWTSIPYGTPLRHQSWRVLDSALNDRPDAVTGDLYIGGAGLALGYWGDPDKTRERFITHPVTGERLYKTGDLGRYFPDGSIEFLGRADHQVKVRGHRVELGEIEATLLSHPAVSAAVAGAVDRRRLVAWYVPAALPAPVSAVSDRWASALAQARAAAARLPLEQDVGATLDALGDRALGWVQSGFARLGFFRSEGEHHEISALLAEITPSLHTWARRALGALTARGWLRLQGDGFTANQAFPLLPPPLPADASDLVEPYGLALPEILRGQKSSLELFFAGGDLEAAARLYALGFDEGNAVAAALTRALAPAAVLEVGAGVGSATRHLLPALEDSTSYLFTDVSRAFLDRAREVFGRPGLRTTIFDVDRDPLDQGLPEARQDLVIAVGALHVAKRLSVALERLARLLRPGGALVLVEHTRFLPMMHLLPGLQPGFDHFEDRELRAEHCLLGAPQWAAAMREAGFDTVEVLAGPNADATSVRVIVGRRDPRAPAVQRVEPEELSAYLAARLPEIMVPGAWVRLSALPLSQNGKLDRAALPLPADEGSASAAPSSPLEAQIAQIWADVLGLPSVGTADDFFSLGGDSLVAVRLLARLRDTLGADVPLATLYGNPTVARLAARVSVGAAPQAAALRPDPARRFDPFPLTDLQQAYWLGRTSGLAGGDVASWVYVEIDTPIHDPSRWESAWKALIEAHDALRIVLLPEGAQQVLKEAPPWSMEVLDLRGALPEAIAARTEALAQPTRPLYGWPLFDVRATLLDAGLRLHLGLDVLVVDGRSFSRLIGQWVGLASGAMSAVSLPEISFRDVVMALQEETSTPSFSADRAWWLERLPTLPPAPELPTRRESGASGRFVRRAALIDDPRWARLSAAAARRGLTPASALLTAYASVLAAWSGRPSFSINLTLFHRPALHPEIDAVVGELTLTDVLALSLDAGRTVAQEAASVQARLTDDLDHRRFSGVRVLRELAQQRRGPVLMPVVFTGALGLSDAALGAHGTYGAGLSQTPQVWLDHQAVGGLGDGGVRLIWDAAEDRFLPGVLDAMFSAYLGLLQRLIDSEDAWDQPLPPLLPEAQAATRQAVNTWDGAPARDTLHGPFVRQAARTPDAVAVEGPGKTLRYGELEAASRALAWRVLRSLGEDRSELVAVLLPKGPDQAVATLGILRAGRAYLPMDPDLPAARIQTLLEDGGVRVVVSDAATLARLAGALPEGLATIDLAQTSHHNINEDAGTLPDVDPSALAYVIYTSGSTGKPKGVMISHEAAWNTVADINARFGVTEGDRVLALSALSFDLSVYDLFGLLAVGGAVVFPPPDGVKDPSTWPLDGITVWNTVPQLMEMLLDAGRTLPSSLRLAMWSGDWIPLTLPGRVRAQVPGARLISLGGATEASIWSIGHEIADINPEWTSIPYGTPLRHQSWRVLDGALNDRPDAVTGDLYIGGVGLALGYWGDPEKTRERFITHPVTGERLYKTGDLGRYFPDGSIEFLGRADHQVKVRGHRVELGEIEATLLSHPAVSAAVAGAVDRRRLVAWIVTKTDVLPDDLLRFLASRLPEHMVPGDLIPLESLPLSPNGKLDRAALPLPAERRAEQGPMSALQRAVAAIWAETLGVSAVGPHDDFFRLGGDSMVAVRLSARLRDRLSLEVSVRDVFARPTVAELCATLSPGASTPVAGRVPAPLVPDPDRRFDPFPLTDLQHAYWLGRGDVALGGVGSFVYLELEPDLSDAAAWERAFLALIEAHDALRTVFLPDATQVVLRAAPPWRLELTDLRGQGDVSAALAARSAALRQQLLDPARWPLFDVRATLYDGPEGEILRLHVGLDVLVADGWSVVQLLRQWAELARHPAPQLTPPALSFRDVVLAQLAEVGSAAWQADLDWWRARLDSLPPAPELPQTTASGPPSFVRRETRLSPDRWRRLQGAAAARGLTPSSALLAIYAATLAAFSARPRFTVNLSLFHRPAIHPDIEAVLGDFTRTNLLELDLRPEPLAVQAQRFQSQLMDDLEHGRVGGVRVLRELAQRAGGAVPMPVVFTGAVGLDRGERTLGRWVGGLTQTPQVVLDNQVLEVRDLDGAGLLAVWDAAEERFPAGVLDAMFGVYTRLLERLADQEERWDQPLPPLLPEAQAATRQAVNTGDGAPARDTLHGPFLRQAARTPDRVAVEGPAGKLTYGELEAASRALALRLLSLGERVSELVAVLLPKGPDQAVATLGILRSGRAYLPVDPDLPAARIRTLLEDGGVAVIVSDAATLARLAGALPEGLATIDLTQTNNHNINEDAGTLPDVAPSALAYVIYTSGSTGKPKGVMISHEAAWNTIADINARFGVTEGDRVLALSALSFDLSVYDLFGLLAVGGTLVFPPSDGVKDPHTWPLDGITVWNTVPQLMEMLLDAGRVLPTSLRLAMWSGDWIPLTLPARVRAQVPGARLISLGGATEASIWSIGHEITDINPEWTSIPYGTPLRHQSWRVLDGALNDRPDAVTGDLYIGGAGLALGYWGDPDKTRERFITHPATGERLYKTGDLGCYFPDGSIEFLGRADHQVKVRGHRVELGEIEATLLSHPAVSAAVAGAVDRRRLVAWIVTKTEVAPDDLLRFLASRLPEHMVPGDLIPLESLPLSPNGKLDRAALPLPAETIQHTAPETALERAIAGVWADVLRAPAVGRHDAFFQLGGDSLLAVRVAARLGGALGTAVPVRLLLGNPTVASLAAAVTTLPATGPLPALIPDPAARYAPFPLTDVQRAYWMGRTAGLALGGVATWVYLELEPPLTDPAAWERSWRALIGAHDALRTVFASDGTQRVLAEVPAWSLPVLDLRGAADAEAQLTRLRQSLSQQVLPADRWPLFDLRAARYDGPEGEVLRLIFGLDVLLADGFSVVLLLREWARLAQQRAPVLQAPPLAFRDVVLALAAEEGSPAWEADRAFWLERLPTLPPAPELPLRRDANAEAPRFERRVHRLPTALWRQLQQGASQRGLTPATLLLTAYATVLSAFSARPDLTLNLTLYQRPALHPAIEEVVGDFTVTSLLAVEPRAQEGIAALAQRLHQQLRVDLDHGRFSGVRVLRELSQRRGGPALMPVVFTSGLSMGMSEALSGLGRTVYGVTVTPQVWLDHQVGEDQDGLLLMWDAAEDRFLPGVLDAMFGAYTLLLERLADQEESWDQPLPSLLPEGQRAAREAVNTWDGTPARDTLHGPFVRQAAKTPDAVAVEGPGKTLRYGELEAASRALAWRVLRSLGEDRSKLVAVLLPKGPDQAVATLGILRAGRAYLPVDPDLPAARIRTLLEDGGVRVVVSDAATLARLAGALPEGLTTIDLTQTNNDNIDEEAGTLPDVDPSALAYVIYTSGSTGKPKGVMISHEAAWNTIADINARFGVTEGDRVLALSALSFDLSVYDLFGLLAVGGALVFPPSDGVKDPSTWPLDGITVWNTVPQLMEMLLDAGRVLPSSLRLAMWSGDWIPLTLPGRVRAQVPGARLISLGGATEASIWSIWHEITDINPEWTSIPYGTPLRHQSWRVLDGALNDRPDAVTGDLYIGGAGLALGYWGDPEKTRERFITHPVTGERLYKTGDLGRYFPDGSIEFLGRADHQVKVRGHRVELGEIEATLLSHPAVSAAVAGAVDRRRLVAWVVPQTLAAPISPVAARWEEALAAGRQLHQTQPEPSARFTAFEARSAVWTADHMALALAALGFFRGVGEARTEAEVCSAVIPTFHRWVRRALRLLADAGRLGVEGARYVALRAPAEAEALLPEAVTSSADEAPLLRLLHRYGEALPEILRGQKNPLEILFEGGQSDEALAFYQGGFAEANAVLTEVIARLQQDRPLRVLEFGAGTGGTTRALLPRLAPGTTYTFTDVSRYFLEIAARDLAFDGLSTAVFDVDRDPRAQGFAPASQDVVIGASVLHAAKRLDPAIGHLARLVAPGGALVLIEATRLLPVLQLVMGLQPGFDHFEDTELRPEHCLVDRQTWEERLRAGGFDDVRCFARPGSLADRTGVMVIVARRAPTPVQVEIQPEALRAWLGERLPEHMVPSALLSLPALPLTPNGKLDRAALPVPRDEQDVIAPRTPMERLVSSVWATVLGQVAVSVTEPFFALGGDSLSAVRVASRLGEALSTEVPLRMLLANPDAAALAAQLDQLAPGAARTLVVHDAAGRHEPFPLTDVQRAYWMGRSDAVALGGVSAWVYLELETDLADTDAWESAWKLLIVVHDALRTVVLPDGNQVVLREAPPWRLPVLDLRGRADQGEALLALRGAMAQQARSPERWPLFDVRAVRLGDADRPGLRLCFGLDVIAADGWSLMSLLRQWGEAARTGLTPGEPGLTFRDVVLATVAEEGTPAWEADRSWWRARLDTLPPGPALPLASDAEGASSRFVRRLSRLDTARWSRLQRGAAQRGITPATALITAYTAVLGAWSTSPDFTLNLTLFDRPPIHPDMERLVGDFTVTNLLAVRAPADDTPAQLAQRTHAQLSEDLDHRRFSGIRVLRELSQRRGGPVLMPVVFTSGLSMGIASSLDPVGRPVWGLSQTPQVWLDHQVGEDQDGLFLNWDAAEDRFLPGVLDAMFGAYTRLLERLADQEDAWEQPIGALLPEAQAATRQAVNTWAGEPARETLHGPFVRQAARTPERIAVEGPAGKLTYGGLEAESRRLALSLLGLGERRSELVAVLLPKGPDQAVATLGILRAGLAYLPVDPDLPAARIRTLLEDGGVQVVVSDGPTLARLEEALPEGLATIDLTQTNNDNINEEAGTLPDVDPSALAYVIYTSGSTGKPKGVMISHEAAWNTIADINARFGVTEGDRVLALSALSFDLSVYDLFGLLAVGGTVVFPPSDGVKDPSTWPLDGITVWNTVPQLMEMLLDAGRVLPSSLRLAMWSGDWIPLTLPARVRVQVPSARLISLGGATEASIWSIGHEITDINPKWTSIPYGTPLRHQSWRVLDSALNDRPDAVTGDLYIGGVGLALGYWGDPDKTAERFITHPVTGERLYKTGDLGRYFPDGSIEFLGRADHQVKVRGHRVELGEIEATLLSHPAVSAAVAGAVDRRRLVAWIVTTALPVPVSPAEPAWAKAVSEAWIRQHSLAPPAAGLAELQAALGVRAMAWVGAAFREMGLPLHDADALEAAITREVVPVYRRWVRRGVAMLAGQALPEAPEPATAHPLLALLDRLGAQIPTLLRGEVSALELFYARGESGAATDFYALAFSDALAVLAGFLDALPSGLRVLEVGAGGGGTTTTVVRHAREASYTFTDVSRLFLEDASHNFPQVRTAILDLDQPLGPQGFRPGQQDLVVAGGALHVVKDLRSSLRALTELLAPGGALLLIEATRFWPMMQVLTALQPGFDAFEDTDLRPDHCLLGLSAWTSLLHEVGFERVEVFQTPGSSAEITGTMLIVAQLPASRSVSAPPDADEIRAFAAARLPEHMVPSALVALDSLPLTPNGKVDRAALPVPSTEVARRAPQTTLERAVAAVWSEVLGTTVALGEPFFALGGDSLSAVRVAARLGTALGREVPLRLLLANPDVGALAQALEAHNPLLTSLGAVASAPPLTPDPAARFAPFPLTDVQRAYWLGRAPGLALGGVATWFYLEFEPEGGDVSSWERAWVELIGAHDALRTIVNADGEQQVLASPPPWSMRLLDLRGRADPEPALRALRAEMAQQVLPADRWPLFDVRASLYDGPEGPVLRLHFGLDLLVADGWGMMTLIRQWGARAAGGAPPRAPELLFRDCVLALARDEGSPGWEADKAWWLARLDDLPLAPALPVRAASDAPSARFARREARLDGATWSDLKRQAARQGLTPASALLSAFARTLAGWSLSPDLTINLTLFNRPPLHPEVEQVVGDFTSTLLLETHNPAEEAFAAAATRLQRQLVADLEHRRFGGLRVQRELSQRRGEALLFPVVFTSGLSMGGGGATEGGRYIYGLSQTPQVLLDHQVGETGDGLLLSWDTAEDRFLPGVLDAMFGFYLDLLRALAAGPAAWTDTAWTALPRDQAQLRARLNMLEGAPAPETLHGPFLRQAARTPDAVAVEGPTKTLRYAQLAAASRSLALRLLEPGPAGEARAPLVAVMLPKGPDQAVATLGVLRAGLAWLPIDPDLPPARVRALLEDGGVHTVVIDAATAGRLADALPAGIRQIDPAQTICDETAESGLDLPEIASSSLAYVIYTSGSTGKPKGVMVTHEAAWNTVADINQRWSLSPTDRVLALSALSFDLAVYDLFGPLAVGGAVVFPANPRDPGSWAEALARGVTIWNSVPQLLDLYLEGRGALPEGLRLVLLSGDWIPVSLPGRIRQQSPEARIVSLGGATEASIWSIFYEIRRVDPRWTSIPYGQPLTRQCWSVRGPDGRERPDGVTGELWIGGVGLALGYWGDPEKTAERFISHRGERWYRTGDLGRYGADGTLEFLGRLDAQVKISGHRVELGEVEAALLRQGGVTQAVALALGERNERRLVAAVVGSPRPDPDALRQALAAELPAYMVPSRVLALDALPLGATGKVDTRALSAAFSAALSAAPTAALTSTADAAPTDDRRALVLSIAREVLGLPDLEPDANLLRMGANSIDLIRLGNRLSEALGVPIEGARLLLDPTLDALLAQLGAPAQAPARPADAPTPEIAGYALIKDPDAREAFKATDPGQRRDLDDRPALDLDPEIPPSLALAFARRRSHRFFGLEPISTAAFGRMLGALRRGPIRADGRPGYLYASAGGVYAIQVYLHVKAGRVAGLEPGAWHYDPIHHRLLSIDPGARLPSTIHLAFLNQPIAEEAAFSVFLVAELAALGPLYGEAATRLALLEAGGIAHLLESAARDEGLGTCQIGQIDEAPVREALALAPHQALLHTLLGGPVEPNPNPASGRQARLIERIRRLPAADVRALIAARKRASEDE